MMRNKRLRKIIMGALVAVSIIGMNPVQANAAWKQDKYGWWYTEGNSWATGWRLIDGNWYYFNENGYMESDIAVDGYYLNKDGAYTLDEPISLTKAKSYLNLKGYSYPKYMEVSDLDENEENVQCYYIINDGYVVRRSTVAWFHYNKSTGVLIDGVTFERLN